MKKEPIRMSDSLRRKVEKATPMQRKYAEYRAKGLSQSESAKKAGSEAGDTGSLGRVGYRIEQTDGIKDYIAFLIEKRAEAAMVDSIEVLDKLRTVYDEAMAAGKFADANKATELLATMAGFLGKARAPAEPPESKKGPKNNVSAFKDEDETPEERMKKLSSLIKDTAGRNNS